MMTGLFLLMPIVLLLLLLLGTAEIVKSSSHQASPSTTTTAGVAAHYPRGRDRPHEYEILNEEIRYSGWRIVVRRSVGRVVASDAARDDNDDRWTSTRRERQSRIVEYDVVDQARATGGAVIIFAWNSTSKTATIVREYMPGPHRILGGLAAGIVENDKHRAAVAPIDLPGAARKEEEVDESSESSTLVAARFELEEECHLAGGTWYRLTDEGVSVPMDKYAVTEITPYLVIDPYHVDDPRPLDDEEDIEIVRGVSAREILRMIREGDFNLVGGWGALLALEKLRELGEII